MSIKIACPTCGAPLSAPDHKAGRRAKCPRCGSKFAIPGVSAYDAPLWPSWVKRAKASKSKEAPLQSDAAQSAPDERFEEATRPTAGRRDALAEERPERLERSSNTVHSTTDAPGVISLIFGILAMVGVGFSCCGFGFFGIPLALIGTVLAFFARGNLQVAGFTLNLLALFPGILVVTLFFGMCSGLRFWSLEKSGSKGSQAVPTAVTKAAPAQTGPVPSAVADKKTTPKAPDLPKLPEWQDARLPIRRGNVILSVSDVEVGIVNLTGIGGTKSRSKDELLRIQLSIGNEDANKIVQLRGWGSSADDLFRNLPALTDNFGNTYRLVHFGIFDHPEGQVVGTKDIYPGRYVSDVLLFNRPVDGITYLRLRLPGSNIGVQEDFHFEITRHLAVLP